MRNVILLVVGILACAGTAAWTDDRPANEDRPAVSRESKQIEVLKCSIKAVKSARLATDRPGVLAEIELKEGDSVKENQIVARLMDDVPKANLDVANLVADDEVEIKYATKLHEVDRVEYQKNLKANQQHFNTIPEIDVLRSKLAADRSLLQIDKARHEIDVNKLKAKQSEAELKSYWIKAPFDGVVTSVVKHRGEAVHQGDPILEVVNPNVVRVEGKVKEQDIWNVKVGSPVIVHLAIPNVDLNVEKRIFRGTIGFVDVVANSVTFETRVWADIPNPDNTLRPGLLATMTILPNSSDVAGFKTSRHTGAARVTRDLSQP